MSTFSCALPAEGDFTTLLRDQLSSTLSPPDLSIYAVIINSLSSRSLFVSCGIDLQLTIPHIFSLTHRMRLVVVVVVVEDIGFLLATYMNDFFSVVLKSNYQISQTQMLILSNCLYHHSSNHDRHGHIHTCQGHP